MNLNPGWVQIVIFVICITLAFIVGECDGKRRAETDFGQQVADANKEPYGPPVPLTFDVGKVPDVKPKWVEVDDSTTASSEEIQRLRQLVAILEARQKNPGRGPVLRPVFDVTVPMWLKFHQPHTTQIDSVVTFVHLHTELNMAQFILERTTLSIDPLEMRIREVPHYIIIPPAWYWRSGEVVAAGLTAYFGAKDKPIAAGISGAILLILISLE